MSATAFNNIESAISVKLASTPDLPDIAWPNAKFTPITGTPYLRFNILFSEPAQNTLGETGRNMLRGFAQIDCVFPALGGTQDSRATVGLIADAFKRGTDLVYNGQTVTITGVYPSGRTIESDWMTTPITINFFSIVEN